LLNCQSLIVVILEFNMSSKGEIVRKFSLRRCILAIMILCTSAWWASGDALAEEAASALLKMTAHSTFWSLEGPGPNTAPHLVITMADRGDIPSYGSLRLARDEAANPSARNAMSRTIGPMAFANSAEKGESGPLVLSSLFESTAGVFTDFHAEGTNRLQVLRRSPGQTSAKVCSLLDDSPALGSFIHEYRIKYSLSTQWLTDSDSYTHEKTPSARLRSGATSRTITQAAAIILIIAISRSSHAN
jgi:hypothetical protein